MDKKTRKIIKILRIINQIAPETNALTNQDKSGPGRKQVYSELSLFKIFVVMYLTNVFSIQGVWRILMENKKLKKECGLENNIDRSTLNRRLSDKISFWFN